MVTILRSSIGREAEARRAPHSEQNFASGAFFEPQDEHVITGEAYVAMAQVPNGLRWWQSLRGASASPLSDERAYHLGGRRPSLLAGRVHDRGGGKVAFRL